MKLLDEFGRVLRLVERPGSDQPARVAEEKYLKAQSLSEAARFEEQQGFPFTAAMQWREAAELFADHTDLAERCWREWERIMGLPRSLVWEAPHRQAA
jgi:hypothetical protein